MTWDFSQTFADSSLSTKCSTKGAVLCFFCRALEYTYFGKFFPILFASTWKKSLKQSIYLEFFLIKGLVQGALRKEQAIASFV